MTGDMPFVVVIGGANIDIHGKSIESLRANDSNPGTVHISAGGVARNVAENLARLHVDCRLVSVIGNDHHGQMLMRLSCDAGIDMQYVHETASAPTSTYVSVLDDTGDMQVAIADMSIIDQLSAERLQPLQAMLGQATLIIVDANLPDDALAWITGTFTDIPIFADTVSTAKATRLKPYLSSLHTLKTSTIEVEALTGMQARTQAELLENAARLHDEGIKRIYITRGDEGVFYSTGNAQGVAKQKYTTRGVHNAGGAGDAFLAGLTYAWLESWPMDRTLQFALAAADVTLSHRAACSPALSLAAIEQAIENQRAG